PDEALFVLLACEGQGKSDQRRIFDPSSLKARPGLVNQLPNAADDVDTVLKILKASNPRFVNPVGSGIVCTTEGDLVKHAFDGLRSDLKVNGYKPSQVMALK